MFMANLTGTWLGTYWQHQQPTRFEVTFVQSGNTLMGNILDDGPLGEARVQGTVVGRNIHFIKTYVANPRAVPVDYAGTMETTEDFMQGSWSFPGTRESGPWEARRSGDNLVANFSERLAKVQ
jgi:hypothetical protein